MPGFVDTDRIRALRGQYGEILTQLVTIYAATTPPILDTLRSAIERDDHDAAVFAAHQLKGASRNVGATFIADIAQRLEDAPDLALVEQIEGALPHTCKALGAALADDARVSRAEPD